MISSSHNMFKQTMVTTKCHSLDFIFSAFCYFENNIDKEPLGL